MSQPASMTVNGKTQGNITAGDNTATSIGNNVQPDYPADSAVVQGFSMEIFVPTDTQSGQPTGKCQIPPTGGVQIYKQTSASSPLLWTAAQKGENLTIVVDFYWIPSASSTPEKYFEITFNNATITSFTQGALNALSPVNASLPEMDTIKFNYGSVQWQQLKANTQANYSFAGTSS